jgi:O-antigen/teichoic acid export membrane protein
VHSTVGPNSLTLKVFRRLRVTVLIDLSALGLGIGLSIALIAAAGADGAALAFLLAVTARNVAYQGALRRITGITLRTRGYLRLQATVGTALAALVAVQVAVEPGIVVAVVLSAAAGIAVMRACAPMLDVESTFPELARGPLRRLFPPSGGPGSRA